MNKSQIDMVEKAKEYMKEILVDENSGHDYFHCMRVYSLALSLSDSTEANKYVIALTALLHDLDDEKINKNTNHVQKFLEMNKIAEAKVIQEIINNMSYRHHQSGKKLHSKEGQIVQDADRLDALGAIGIARCFAYTGFVGRPIYNNEKDDDSAISHFYQKLLLLPELMNTEKAKTIALQRVKYMKDFLEKFYQEWEADIK